MYTAQAKKLLIINILDILRKYSDGEHRLSQRDIQNILQRDYEMKAERKAIKRNLMNLIDCGYQIEYTETQREGKSGAETICSDWYLVRDFDDSELRLLIDSLLFSKHIPYSQCKALIDKLRSLSNQYFQTRVKFIRSLPESHPVNKQLFYTIDVLDEAIGQRRKVLFYYNEMGVDKKLHLKQTSDGQPREYLVNPYQMAAANGRYYLIGNYDKYDNVSHYRLDRISDIRLADAPAKPMKQVKGLEHGLNLPRHMAEHIYMFAGESAAVTFRAQAGMAGEIVDWFGADAQLKELPDGSIQARVKVNQQAMFFWLLQYGPFVEVLEPESLREQVREAVQNMAEKYK